MTSSNKFAIQKAKFGILFIGLMGPAGLAITPSYAAIAQQFSLSNTMVQMLTSATNLFMMIASLAVGKLATLKIREKTLVMVAFALIVIGGLAPLLYHDNFYFLLICTCLVGLGEGSCLNLVQVLLAKVMPKRLQQAAMGQRMIFTNLGAIVFIMGGGVLAAHNWVNNYIIYIFAAIIMVIVAIMVPSTSNVIDIDNVDTIDEKKENSTGKVKYTKWVWYVSILAFFSMVLNNVLNNNISLYVVSNHLGGTTQAAFTSTICLIGGMIAGTLTGYIAKYFKYTTVAITFVLYGLAFLIIGWASTLSLIFIASFIVGSSMALAMGQYNYLLSISVDRTSISMVLGVYVAIYSIGGMVSPFIVNTLTKAFSSLNLNVFTISGILSLIIAIAIFATRLQKRLIKASGVEEDNDDKSKTAGLQSVKD